MIDSMREEFEKWNIFERRKRLINWIIQRVLIRILM